MSSVNQWLPVNPSPSRDSAKVSYDAHLHGILLSTLVQTTKVVRQLVCMIRSYKVDINGGTEGDLIVMAVLNSVDNMMTSQLPHRIRRRVYRRDSQPLAVHDINDQQNTVGIGVKTSLNRYNFANVETAILVLR